MIFYVFSWGGTVPPPPIVVGMTSGTHHGLKPNGMADFKADRAPQN
jgi:hypothetical protein